MPCLPLVAATVFAIAFDSTVAAAEPPREAVDGAKVFAPEEIEWTPGPRALRAGASMAVLEGDLTSEGPFVFWVKLPDGFRILPHVHPKSERVNVISGTLHCGVGEAFDRQVQEQGYRVRTLQPGYDELIEAGFEKADEDTR